MWLADWLKNHDLFYQVSLEITLVLVTLAAAWYAYRLAKRHLLGRLERWTTQASGWLGASLAEHGFFDRALFLVPLLVGYACAPLFPFGALTIRQALMAALALILLTLVSSLMSVLNDAYTRAEVTPDRPIKGYIQVAKIVMYIVGGIVITSYLFGQSPMILLSGFGAMTAVILLVFKDTLLSFVASLMIGANDLVRVGDWIESPRHNADGDVIDIALHTITVQNFDKTLTIIPTHKLIDETFRNWRGMKEAGGRRIKRAVHIDMNTIRFLTAEDLERFARYRLIRDYIAAKRAAVEETNEQTGPDCQAAPVNQRRLTNIGVFRAYVAAYLKNHPRVRADMTFLIRQLPPGPTGLPLEIYIFADTTDWAEYESIQADIFDHVLAVVPEFGLSVFQNPAGRDLARLAGA